jgi:hypothetical protein
MPYVEIQQRPDLASFHYLSNLLHFCALDNIASLLDTCSALRHLSPATVARFPSPSEDTGSRLLEALGRKGRSISDSACPVKAELLILPPPCLHVLDVLLGCKCSLSTSPHDPPSQPIVPLWVDDLCRQPLQPTRAVDTVLGVMGNIFKIPEVKLHLLEEADRANVGGDRKVPFSVNGALNIAAPTRRRMGQELIISIIQ